MDDLAQLLESELSQAFEVKDRESLHRYVVLLTKTYVERTAHESQYEGLRSDIKDAVAAMEHGFEMMDARFEALQKQIDERFDARQKQMDTRFDAQQKLMEERFDAQQKQMDERFSATERRFEDMNRRFDSMDERFKRTNRLIGLGITLLALLISAFNAALLFA